MNAVQLEEYLRERIPLSRAMAVEVRAADATGVELYAPLAPNINHRDTVFGGSASAVAILAALDSVLGAVRAELDGGYDNRIFISGFLVNATNPKGIIFMLAVLPQFIDPTRPQFVQYAICAATLFFTDLVVMAGYTGLASRVLAALRAPSHIRWVNRAFGSLFVAAGAVLATFRRAA